ncbi:MAG: hypothetical protein JNL79_17970 [Myxococcales bacterium]|nr:hypothetical protein [Myxococcales bacterium]
MDAPFLLRLGLFAYVGCASADFKVGDSTDAAADTALDARPDTLVDVNCPPLGATDEILVDSNSVAATPNGTTACPYRTIRDALAVTVAGTPRLVRVKGTPGGRVYSETTSLVVKTGVTLVSEGLGNVVITGPGGSCAGAGATCMVQVNRGANLDGFVVQGSAASVTLVSISGAGAGGVGPATVKNTRATKAVGDGAFAFLVNDGAVLGPNVESLQNPAVAGLQIYGTSPVRVTGSNSRFNNNLWGINHEGGGSLTIEGGVTANLNARSGVRIFTALGVMHTISALTAGGNAEAGLVVVGGSVTVRQSSFNAENKVGVVLNGAPGVVLDLGTAAAVGNNVFGTTSGVGSRNKYAGVCVDGLTVELKIGGNRWTGCSPSTATLAGSCADVPTEYKDILLRGASGGSVSTSPCTPG